MNGVRVDRLFITLAALSGCLAVGFGAFGAHALRERLSGDALQVFQTGVTYQMYHALALLAVGILLARFSTVHRGLAGPGDRHLALTPILMAQMWP